MNEIITVDRALARGQYTINLPVLGIMFGAIGICLYVSILKLYPDWLVFSVGIALALVLPWLYWSFMITKWRIWAFENVRNVHELKKRAIQDKLIWPDSSIFVKTEIRTKQDKERLLVLESKFDVKDEFLDDVAVPNETAIFYDKGSNLFEMAMAIAGMGAGVYLLLMTDSYILGFLLFAGCAYAAYREYKEAMNKTPQIILNEQGIQTVSTKFQEWKRIRSDEAVTEGYGKNNKNYLVYTYQGGSEHLLIDDYNINRDALNKLLRLYRGRSNKATGKKVQDLMGWVIPKSEKFTYHTDLTSLVKPIWEDIKDLSWLASDLDFMSSDPLPVNLEDDYFILNPDQFEVLVKAKVQMIWGVFSGVPADRKMVVDEDNLPYADLNKEMWQDGVMQYPDALIEIICFDSTDTIVRFSDPVLSKKFKAYFEDALEL